MQHILSSRRGRATGRRHKPARFLSSLAGLTALFLVCLVTASCEKNKSSNSTGTPAQPELTVVSSDPIPSNQAANPNGSVSVTFNKAVDATTVSETSFYVDTVSGTRTVNGATITFTPTTPFVQGTTYNVTVTSEVADMGGESLANAYTFSFRVAMLPTANAGNDTTATKGVSFTLDGSNSVDPDGGTLTYLWKQLAGPSVGNLMGVQPSITAPDEITAMQFELTVSNGSVSSNPDTVTIVIAEDGSKTLFVSKNGNDANPGTIALPFATLRAAGEAAYITGADIYVAAGTYNESVSVQNGVSMYGGFSKNDWMRDRIVNETIINGTSYALFGSKASNLTIDGFTIKSANGISGSSPSSVGLGLNACQNVTVSRNNFVIGNGGNGSAGLDRADRTGSAAGGDDGSNAYFALTCDGRSGGDGGDVSYGRDGGKGGRSGGSGGGAKGANGENGGGAGGAAGGFAADGKNGSTGAPGDSGKSGLGGPGFGQVFEGGYYDGHGENGGNGEYGFGGGGGGGGGTGAACSASGGGGGAGGLNGLGGYGGGGGGASIGIILSAGSDANIFDNTILLGKGGNGAPGGTGGAGQNGGGGGDGGNGNANGGAGGDGGNGGKGGRGGYGGAGGGGPVVGIVEESSTSTRTNNTITLGTPGKGGSRADGKGLNGTDGERAEYKKIS